MKKRLVFLLMLAPLLRVAAQLPPGGLAPDFTAPDLDGQSWHLYELLDQHKIVVLEISATWCPPCWTYHDGHALQDLYTAHGPDGDDRLRVLFVEGDPHTEPACLYGPEGCSDYTPGNWVEGTDFPMIDDADIADAYQIAYYPTLFVICPNRKAYEVNQLNASDLWEKTQVCPVASGVQNAGLYDYTTGSDFSEICGSITAAPAFSLINLGTDLLTQATIELHWNDELVQSLPWTGNLPLYGEAPLSFDDLVLQQPGTLTATLSEVNGTSTDDDESNNLHTDVFVAASHFSDQQILMKIRTDQYGAETYWELHDDQGNVIDHGGNPAVGPAGGGQFPGAPPVWPGAYANNTTINEILNLPGPGCYSLHFTDAYGDGMCCGFGNGYYKLYNYDNPGQLVMSGGDFESYDHRAFADGQPALDAPTPADAGLELAIFPNPATDRVAAQWTVPEGNTDISATVLNALGQPVSVFADTDLPAGEFRWTLDTASWPAGWYALHLRAGPRSTIRTFLKN